MKTFGASLRAAREHAGLSVEEVFRQTRISLKHLHAIESGDFPSLPQTYVRAFIREYATIVGLDPDDIIERYNELAEREKGIPRPPEAIDSSNILPHADDSIEILPPGKVIPKHVVIEGRPEVEKEDFVPPVRKSRYVAQQESLGEAVDGEDTLPPPRTSIPPPILDLTGEDTASPSRPFTSSITPSPPTSYESVPMAERARQLLRRFSGGSGVFSSPPPTSPTSRVVPATATQRAPLPALYRRKGFPVLVITGLILLVIIVGALQFPSGGEGGQGLLDSAAVQEGINAGRYTDTTQAFDLSALTPEDTATATSPEDAALEPSRAVYAQEDSLVLEAVTSAPVWYSIRMDTLRTERGNLSSNDHRVWKAKDHFHVTLGDAGAVTFFLNGREIGSLGDEGAVVKNAMISRSLLKPE